MAQMKAKEKEMKEEKEEERQVCELFFERILSFVPLVLLTISKATSSSNQGQARQKGREGTIREDGREDAPQASGSTEAQGEAKQALELMRQNHAQAEERRWEYLHCIGISMAPCISYEVLTMDTRCGTTTQ